MRTSARLLFSILFCAASAVASHADTINTFTVTGGDGTFSFSIAGSATPSSVSNNDVGFTLSTATYNGTQVSGDTVYFFTTAGGGGLFLTNSGGTFNLNEFGPQIFSGTLANPVFTNSTIAFSNGSAALNSVNLSSSDDVLKITTAVSAVPEPPTFALFGIGFLALAATSGRLPRQI